MNKSLACLSMAVMVVLSGCASTSGQTFATLNRDHPAYESEQCQSAIRETEVHDDLKIVRIIVSPVAVIASGGLLLPAVFAANVGLDTFDRVDASKMDRRCGGEGQSAGQIAEGVVKGAAFGLATNAAGSAISSGGIPTTLTSGNAK